MKFVGLVGLFTKEQSVDLRTIEKNNPVAGKFGVEDRNKIDIGAVPRRFSFPPNANGIQFTGDGAVVFFLAAEVVEMLEGRDQLAARGVVGQILNGMTDR